MATTTSSTSSTSSSLGVGGLISGIDTTSIVNALVAQQQVPITRLQTQQSAFKTQVSQIGDIISKLQALQTAAQDLGKSGALASSVTTSNTAFSATAGTGVQAGSYSVRVDQLARPSKWMSAGFAAASDPVAGGALTLSVGGTSYAPIQTDGMSLADLAFAIRQSGAPVSATILSGWDTANNRAVSYLSVTALNSGYTPNTDPPDSLSLSFAASGGAGTDPAFAEKQAAQNARFSIDGVDYVRSSNTVTDAISGVTLTLKQGAVSPATQGTAEDLGLVNDKATTTANLQKFADAYNAVMSLVQKALAVTKDTDRSKTLAGDAAVRSLQSQLHGIITHVVSGLPNVRTLADIGLKTDKKTGALSVDATTLSDALSRDPAALNSIFSTASSGISDYVDALVRQQTSTGSGILAIDQKGLNDRISAMDKQITQMQMRVDAYKTGLLAQFNAMEETLSNLKKSSNYLTQATSSSSSG